MTNTRRLMTKPEHEHSTANPKDSSASCPLTCQADARPKESLNFVMLAIECVLIFAAAQFLGFLVACVGYVCYVYSKKRWGLVKGIGYGLIGVIIAFLAQAFIWGQFLR